MVLEKKLSEAAEEAGRAYSKLDEILPSVFDIKKSKKYTSRLVQPQNLIVRGAMAWSRWQMGDTIGKKDYDSRLRSLLKDNSRLMSKFGAPYYEEDDDRYWRWWVFAVFDGEKWHTF